MRGKLCAHRFHARQLRPAHRATAQMRLERAAIGRVQLAINIAVNQEQLVGACTHERSSPFAATGSNKAASIPRALASRDITVPIGTPVISDISL